MDFDKLTEEIEVKKRKIGDLENDIKAIEHDFAKNGWKHYQLGSFANHYLNLTDDRVSEVIIIHAKPTTRFTCGIHIADPIISAWRHDGKTFVPLTTADACATFAKVMQSPVGELLSVPEPTRVLLSTCDEQFNKK